MKTLVTFTGTSSLNLAYTANCGPTDMGCKGEDDPVLRR